MMKLLKFQVTNFRSVEDSGWIDVDSVTAFIGTNESGKTNLLLPLWKLNPAKDGQINAIADYPRGRYDKIRAMDKKPIFIEAYFSLSDDIAQQVADLAKVTINDIQIAAVKRDLAGAYFISFPKASIIRYILKSEIASLLTKTQETINNIVANELESSFKGAVLGILATVQDHISNLQSDELNENNIQEILSKLTIFENGEDTTSKSKPIANSFTQLIDSLDTILEQIAKPHPDQVNEAKQCVLKHLPSFVYYSNYGNLDSEIYLPHVIANMQRKDLGQREEAKARTLKVLFDFVGLEPEEILQLGYDFDPRLGQNPNQDQIKDIAEKKKEREILLHAASTGLTSNFRAWWKQGDYRFSFSADGNFFRIWVSDDQRPEPIELEGRSTGLQWFLSFYLVFLVESTDSHEGAILLLDEPGLSLHPLAQEDLSNFFENLSQTNQLLYTTHSPFMVDPDHLDRVKAVYINEKGKTVVSDNLRASEKNAAQSRSIFPVHAALGLSVSTILLQGCQPIIVEGTSDQIYLSAIKNYLISKGDIAPKREILFVPAGGVKGVSAVAPILTAKDEELPFAVLDSDRSGRDMANKLKTSLYQKNTDRLIMIGDMLNLPDTEVEDLFPQDFLALIIDRYLPRRDVDFSEEVISNKPIISQIEAYASKYEIELEEGWKVEVAKQVKARMLKVDPVKGNDILLEIWKILFSKLTSGMVAKKSVHDLRTS